MAKSRKAARPTARRTAKPVRRAAPARKPAARKAPARPAPRTVTPYLAVNDAAGAIEWYKKALGAKETSRQMAPGDKIMHAALRIGDSDVFLSDIFPGSDMTDATRSGTPVSLTIYSKDNDRLWKQAVAAGAKITMPLENQFWGDRFGKLTDPFGHSWSFNYPAKMTEAEKERKRAEAMKAFGAGEQPQ